jgi:HSP20 family molecular chaperone IbpA
MYFSNPYFHQAMAQPFLFSVSDPKTFFESVDDKSNRIEHERNLSNTKRGIEHQTVESDEFYKLLLEVPGIKISDINVNIDNTNTLKVHAVRKMHNGKQIISEQKFFVDKKIANISNAKAVLEDGVLTIQMTKTKPTDPVIIDVKMTGTDIVDESTLNNHFMWTLDLPGVKIGDVQVRYHDGNLSVIATRKRGDNIAKISKMRSISEEKFDVKMLNAFLVDGVLTIFAPAVLKVEHNDSEKQQTTRTSIPVVAP